MRSLLSATSRLAGVPLERTIALAAKVTGSADADPVTRGQSGLNYDGCPLQVCLSLSRGGLRVRLLGDPAADRPDIAERYHASLGVVADLLPGARAQLIAPALAASVDALVGAEAAFDPARHPDGVLWVGVALSDPGIAVYLDARDGGVDPQARLARWLEGVCGGPTPDIAALLDAVAAGRVMSAGIEGVAPGYARAKVYWRLAKPAPLESLGIPLLAHEAIGWSAQAIMQDRELPLDGIVFNAGLSAPGGAFVDAKLDICCCPRCVALDAGEAQQLICRLTEHLGLATPDIDDVLEAGELAFVGVGLDRNLEPRLNVYLKPRNLD